MSNSPVDYDRIAPTYGRRYEAVPLRDVGSASSVSIVAARCLRR
jgi:hypothetical protein